MTSENTMKPGTPPEPLSPVEGQEVIQGRYRVVRSLGSGGMGTVQLVLDRRQNYRPLALKRVRVEEVGSQVLTVLKKEFLTLASMRHPNLPRVFDFGAEPQTGDFFFTSEFVSGMTWREAVPTLDFGVQGRLHRFLDELAQVLRALEFLHSLGKVHGDIKPENILVDPKGSDEHRALVKLIDFGLTRRERQFSGKKVLGTPYYVAPETILGSRVDRRTDLYSLGIVLYELVTGQRPFRGATRVEVLKSHLEDELVPPCDLVPDLPPAFGEIIERLLAKAPDGRFQSAFEVIEEINAQLGMTIPLETSATVKAYLEKGKLIGCEKELGRLLEAFARAMNLPAACLHGAGMDCVTRSRLRASLDRRRRAGSPPTRLVALQGGEDARKRDLVDAFRCRAQAQGVAFLEVECDDRESSVPGALEALAQGLADYEGIPQGVSGPGYVRVASALALEVRRGDAAGQAEIGARLARIVAGLLDASRSRPIVLHFHDFHLASSTLVELVSSLLARLADEESAGSRLLITVALPRELALQEQENDAASRFLELCTARDDVVRVHFRYLDESTLRRLLRVVFSGCHFPETFVTRLGDECDGSFSSLLVAMTGLLEKKKLRRVTCGWVLSRDCDVASLTGKQRALVEAKIAELPEHTLHLAVAFACIGHPCELEIAARLSGAPQERIPESLNQLRRLGILRLEKSRHGERYGLVGTAAKHVLYEHVPPSRRARLHDRAGAICEEVFHRRGRVQPKELAYHYLRSRNPLKGVHYGLDAARAFGREFAPRRALEIYEQVLALASDEAVAEATGGASPGAAGDNLGANVSREIATLYFQTGDYQRTLEFLRPLCADVETHAADATSRALLFLETARAEARVGCFGEATQLIRRAQQEAHSSDGGGRVLRVPLLLTSAELSYFRGNTAESLRYANRLLEMGEVIDNPVLRTELYLLLAENHAALNNRETAASYCRQARDFLVGADGSRELALRVFCHGKYLRYTYKFAHAVRQFQLAALLWRKVGAADWEAGCLLELAHSMRRLARPRRARRFAARAVTLYRQTGNVRKGIEARFLRGEVHGILGDYAACQRLLADVENSKIAETIPGFVARIKLSFATACLDGGDLENAGRYLYEAETLESSALERTAVTAKRLLLRSRLARHRGELRSALEEAKAGWRAAREARDPLVLTRIYRELSLLYCILGRRKSARRALKVLHARARRLRSVSTEGWAWLIKGMLMRREGRHEAAMKALGRAHECIKARGSQRDLARLYLEWGLLCLQTGNHEDAYIRLEEGLYLARRLNLHYVKCQFFLALGQLEQELPQADTRRAEDHLRVAENLAGQVPYVGLLSPIQEGLARLSRERGKEEEAGALLEEGRGATERALADLPATRRAVCPRVSARGAEASTSP